MASPRPDTDRGGIGIILAAAVLALLAAAVLAAAGTLSVTPASCQAQVSPTATAAATIPAGYLADYQAAGRAYGIPWTVLAGTGEVETDHGRSCARRALRRERRRRRRAHAIRHRGPGRGHLGRRPGPSRIRAHRRIRHRRRP
jgi:hypothetical protein